MTTKEMAELIGVSRITLSKYLNGKGGISKKSAQKIDSYIQKYNFTPNTHARSLAGKKERIISFISTFSGVSDGVSRINSHFATMFTNYILAEAKKFDYKVLVSITDMVHARSEIEQLFSSSLIRGAILFGLETGSKELVSLYERKFPLVLVNQEESVPDSHVSLVNMDDESCAAFAVQHLFESGHRRFLYIGSSVKRLPALRRARGVNKAFEMYAGQGVSCIFGNADFKEDLAYAYVHDVYSKQGVLPTAIIAANDLMAIGAMHALKDLGFNVPDDVSVIGFDDISISGYLSPPLTTFKIDYQLMAEQTMKQLVSLIDQTHEATDVEIPLEFVKRASDGPSVECEYS